MRSPRSLLNDFVHSPQCAQQAFPIGGVENELSIKLDSLPLGRPYYTHGDLVRGIVFLSPTTNAREVETSFKFTGVAKSRVYPVRAESCLFHFEKTLREGHREGWDSDRTYTWPFEFAFPSGTQSKSWKQRYSDDKDFNIDPGHALPPSWYGGSRAEGEITKPRYNTRWKSQSPTASPSLPAESSLSFFLSHQYERQKTITR